MEAASGFRMASLSVGRAAIIVFEYRTQPPNADVGAQKRHAYCRQNGDVLGRDVDGLGDAGRRRNLIRFADDDLYEGDAQSGQNQRREDHRQPDQHQDKPFLYSLGRDELELGHGVSRAVFPPEA